MAVEQTSSATALHKLFRKEFRYVTKNGLLLLIGNGATAITALALGYVYANYLPKDTFGQYKYLLSLVSLLGAFSLSGLVVALARSAAQGNAAELRHVFRVYLLSHGPMAVATLGIAGYYYVNGNLVYAAALGMAALAQPIINSAVLCLPFLQAKERYARASLYTVLFSIIPAAALVAVLAVTQSLIAILGRLLRRKRRCRLRAVPLDGAAIPR
jgi:O-antigen/teichoic acid export membrane protein